MDIIQHPLVLPGFFALFTGAIAYVLSRWSPLACKALAVLAAVIVLVGGAMLLQWPGMAITHTWVNLGGGITFDLALRATALGMLVLIASAGFVVFQWTSTRMHRPSEPGTLIS